MCRGPVAIDLFFSLIFTGGKARWYAHSFHTNNCGKPGPIQCINENHWHESSGKMMNTCHNAQKLYGGFDEVVDLKKKKLLFMKKLRSFSMWPRLGLVLGNPATRKAWEPMFYRSMSGGVRQYWVWLIGPTCNCITSHLYFTELERLAAEAALFSGKADTVIHWCKASSDRSCGQRFDRR